MIRFSKLKHMGRSPAHYKHALDAGEVESKGPMLFGLAVHSLSLGGQRVVEWTGKVRNGKVWDAFKAEHEGKLILNTNEMKRAKGVAEHVRKHPIARELLKGEHEHELAPWDHLGRACGGRVDVLGPRHIADLKTTTDTAPWKFKWQCIRMAYHAQLAWYRDGAFEGDGIDRECFIIGVETKPPYAITPFRLTDSDLDLGRRAYRMWLEKLMVCEESDTWPAYTETTLDLNVPDEQGDGEIVLDDEEEEAA